MQSTFCVNCKQPLPAGAAFCSNCGARQAPANSAEPTKLTVPPPPDAGSNAPTQLTPPPAPPSGDNTPTMLAPPPPPEETIRASAPPNFDPYASQYNVSLPPPPSAPPAYPPYAAPGSGPGASGPYPPAQQPPFPAAGSGPNPGSYPTQPASFIAPPPPPGYMPGPPPVMAPAGVAPQAQPPKKKRGRFALGCVVTIVLIVLLLGGGSVLAFRLLSSNKNTSNTGNHSSQQTGNTPGATPTPTPTSTPGVGNGAQTLTNLNIQAIYAGVTITIMSAQEASTVPGYQPNDPSMNALRIQARLDNSADTHDVYLTDYTTVVGTNGNPYDIATTGISDSLPGSIPAQANVVGYWYFTVPQGTNINDWKVVIGQSNESLVTVPLNAAGYDPSVWQWTTTPLTAKNTVTYYGGALTGKITKVTTGLWTPGYQAPQGKRFILVDLFVTNNSAADVSVGDPEFALLLPDGTRENQKTSYGYFINDDLGGHESKDEGYICFLAPPAKGDFQMIFFNQQNGVEGMIDLGTI